MPSPEDTISTGDIVSNYRSSTYSSIFGTHDFPAREFPIEPEPDSEPACHLCGYVDCECSSCDNCGEQYHNTHRSLCANCYEESRTNAIRDYSTRVEKELPWYPARRKNNEGDTMPFLYLGVELEVERKHNHASVDFSTIMQGLNACSQYTQWAIAKHDASLDDGFEVVTAPSELKVHQERWPFVLNELRKHTASWRRSSTGLHVHISRNMFSALGLAKFIYFINAEENRKEMVMLAGRTSPSFGRLRKKKLDGNIFSNSRRYEAVNLQPANTIEVRLFKGTLSALHVLANVEFCHALTLFVQDHSIQDMTWLKFWEFVHGKVEYTHLVQYMRDASTRFEKWVTKNQIDMTNFFVNTERGQQFFVKELDSEAASTQLPLPVKKQFQTKLKLAV